MTTSSFLLEDNISTSNQAKYAGFDRRLEAMNVEYTIPIPIVHAKGTQDDYG